MTQITPPATPETTSHAAAPQPAALIPPAINPAMIAPPPVEAAREKVQQPESKQEAPMVNQPMQAAANDASIAPPEGKPLPKPTVHTVAAPMGEAANDAHLIEKNIAQFIADRLPAEMRAGLTVDFEESPSNKITSDGQMDQGLRDVCIKFTGGKLENKEVAETLAEQLRAAMREHPAFVGMSFGGADQEIEHMMRCQILALEPERFNKLKEPQPRVNKTFLPGASVSQDGKITVDEKSIEGALAKYLGERLDETQKQGVSLKVEAIAQSNAVTARDATAQQFDILMKLEGGTHSTAHDHKIRELLRHHPVLSKSHLEINEVASNTSEGAHKQAITVRAMGLNAEQLVALIQDQSLQTGTPLSATPQAAHACTGAGCSQCTAPAHAPMPAHPAPHGEHHQSHPHHDAAHPPHAHHDKPHEAHAHAAAAHSPVPHAPTPHPHAHAAAAHAPHAAPHVTPQVAAPAPSVATQVTPVASPVHQVAAPTPVVGVPAHHEGIAASNDNQMRIGA